MEKVEDRAVVAAALEALSIEPTTEAVDHFTQFVKAMRIWQERNHRYGNNWAKYGWTDNFVQMRNKYERLNKQYWHGTVPEEDRELDSAYDLLNYNVFFIMNVLANNERGSG